MQSFTMFKASLVLASSTHDLLTLPVLDCKVKEPRICPTIVLREQKSQRPTEVRGLPGDAVTGWANQDWNLCPQTPAYPPLASRRQGCGHGGPEHSVQLAGEQAQGPEPGWP